MSDSKDILKIFLATDLHLGFLENDPIRGEDSFIVFEEILQHAVDRKVDMILLGGDMFHVNKPSRRTIWKTMQLLRKYCLGPGDIKFRILSDQSINFPSSFSNRVNYEDENVNVAIPVFSIHGNHDDPAGDGGLCTLDLLSMANLVNYFGKSETVDDIAIYPILIEKGLTRLALYGLGYIRDERLCATFRERKVKFMRPSEHQNDWFSIFVLHQNRVNHDPKNCIDEVLLDNFLDFILWGHEHECLIDPQRSQVGDFHICQPGSPLPTSLCDGETKPKHVAVLEIRKEKFRTTKIPLQNVRPFLMDTLDFTATSFDIDPKSSEQVMELIIQHIDALIEKSKDSVVGKDMLPLIRLRIDHVGGYALPNPQKVGALYVGKVANPNEILLVRRKRATVSSSKPKSKAEVIEEVMLTAHDGEKKIGDVIDLFIKGELSKDLAVHDEDQLNEALHKFVEKSEASSFEQCVRQSITTAIETVESGGAALDPSNILELLADSKRKRRAAKGMSEESMSLVDSLRQAEGDSDTSQAIVNIEEEEEDHEHEEEEEEEEENPVPRKRKVAPGKSKEVGTPAKRRKQAQSQPKKSSFPPLEIHSQPKPRKRVRASRAEDHDDSPPQKESKTLTTQVLRSQFDTIQQETSQSSSSQSKRSGLNWGTRRRG